MQNKQLKVFALLFLGFGLTALQAQTMNVIQNHDTQTAYPLKSLRKISFTPGNVNIQKTDNTTGIYAMVGLRYLNFTKKPADINGQQMLTDNARLMSYPNPVADILNIDLTGTNFEAGSISILTLDGKPMLTQYATGSGIETLNLGHLPQGVYICRYTGTTEIKTVLIVKQ